MPLTVDDIVEHGAAIARRDGVDAVSLRSVAGELGVTPMALYRHVDDAAALRAAVVGRLLDDLPMVQDEGTWDDRCRAWAHAAREVLGRAAGLASHVLLAWLDLPRVLLALDGLVAMLGDDGPDDIDAVAAANAVFVQVLMRAQAEESLRAHGFERDLTTLRRHRDEVPALWAHRDEYRVARLDDHFAFGLDAVLTGVPTATRSPAIDGTDPTLPPGATRARGGRRPEVPARARVSIRPATAADLPAITHLFNVLIPTTTVAWRDHLADDAEMKAWWDGQRAAGNPVLVAELDDHVVGYTTWVGFRGGPRFPGYRHSAELTVHVDGAHHGHGIGRALVGELIAAARRSGIHALVAGVDADNMASLALHRSLGFTEVARMPEVGRKFDRWLDLVLLELLIDTERDA